MSKSIEEEIVRILYGNDEASEVSAKSAAFLEKKIAEYVRSKLREQAGRIKDNFAKPWWIRDMYGDIDGITERMCGEER